MLTWTEKRQEILQRDNFTCQICRQFNPGLGTVEVINELDEEIELHEFLNCPDPFQNEYRISQSRTGYTFEINFGNCWPVFPVMQVHHKKYISMREVWDYENEDLITLCKSCHFNFHLSNLIPIFSNANLQLEERMFLPVDSGSGRSHQCVDWTFIQQVGGGEYVVSNINPTISMVLFEHENKQDAETLAKITLDKFIKKYFPKYSKPN